MLPADQGYAPFGPDVSWPAGYPSMEYRDGDYRYFTPQPERLPAAGAQGEHPYAAFSAAGYGDDGYSDPGYQGPAAQDAGIAGTRTVRGFVEDGYGQQGYPPASPSEGYAPPAYPQGGGGYQGGGYQGGGYAGPGYAPGSEIEAAYPPAPVTSAPSAGAYHAVDNYRQPWDYDQPLRYGDEEVYPYKGEQDGPGGGEVRYQPPAYDPGAYNGSDYSMPGINGPGYDLSGIIGTSDFEAVGYDEPSYDRLSYDDPRYADGPGHDGPGYGGPGYDGPRSGRSNETRFDIPRFDETRLDNLWLPADDVRAEAAPVGYGNDGFTESPVRSGYPEFDREQGARLNDTRFDMRALGTADPSHTRFDVPAFDETRLDGLQALGPDADLRPAAMAVLAPPATEPRNWAEDTSLDHFADLDLTDEPVPAAFTRTLERPASMPESDDTATRRAVGRRRGRSSDRRQWMALGAIAVVAAGAIGGVLMKFTFSGPSGPAHKVVAPAKVSGFTESPTLEKETRVAALAQSVAKSSSGQASNVRYAVYDQGKSAGVGGSSQMFMFVGGNLASADPASSISNFDQTYAPAHAVSAGSLGGEAACTETQLNGQSAAMCVWFDNDTFGALVSPGMSMTKLASTLDEVRPSMELLAR